MNEISHKNWNALSDDQIVRQIGKFVRHHRIEQNKTQASLSTDAGISRSTLSLLERGEIVTVATLIQVLRVLGQLQVIDGFTIVTQQSPLLLARAEREKRQRVVPRKDISKDINEEINW
ncbi:MAG: helix-turn-helix transcriptional regulator [Dysgonamonadaceae bacterium]|nr:helix-turn-helix transcriptional regulator [Dysgonamonadaceae bacterium]